MTSIPGIPDAANTLIDGLWNRLPRDTRVVLFGSRAKGTFREGSDIDIALIGPEVTLDHRDRVLADYANLPLPWKLDILVYDLITETALKSHIDRVGIDLRRP